MYININYIQYFYYFNMLVTLGDISKVKFAHTFRKANHNYIKNKKIKKEFNTLYVNCKKLA